MNDLKSKTMAIRQMLADPSRAKWTNPQIAYEVGCEASTVRKVRMEMELEGLRSMVGVLMEEKRILGERYLELEKRLAERPDYGDFPARRPAVPTRRRRDDSRPLLERPDAAGNLVPIVETFDLMTSNQGV